MGNNFAKFYCKQLNFIVTFIQDKMQSKITCKYKVASTSWETIISLQYFLLARILCSKWINHAEVKSSLLLSCLQFSNLCKEYKMMIQTKRQEFTYNMHRNLEMSDMTLVKVMTHRGEKVILWQGFAQHMHSDLELKGMTWNQGLVKYFKILNC